MRELFTTGQVAQICQVSAMTVIRYCDAGKIKAIKSPVTGVRRIPRAELIRFMKSYDIPMDRLIEFEQFRVFIVDDEPAQVDIIKRALQKLGASFEVESATTGYDAIIRIGAFQPDLVVLDLVMPEMDGFQVCRAIRNVPETKDAKILAVTGYASEDNIARAKEFGVDDWMEKPVQIGQLSDKVAELMKLPQAEPE